MKKKSLIFTLLLLCFKNQLFAQIEVFNHKKEMVWGKELDPISLIKFTTESEINFVLSYNNLSNPNKAIFDWKRIDFENDTASAITFLKVAKSVSETKNDKKIIFGGKTYFLYHNFNKLVSVRTPEGDLFLDAKSCGEMITNIRSGKVIN